MWPLLIVLAFVAGCERISEPENKPKDPIPKTPPPPPAASSSAAASAASNPESQGPACELSRDDFIQTASDLDRFDWGLKTKKFHNCFVKPEEALGLLRKDAENLDGQAGLSPLEEASLMTFLGESRYTVLRPNGEHTPFYFRKDLPGFQAGLKDFFQRASEAKPRQQTVFVDFDLAQLFKGHDLPAGWENSLRQEILQQISENYRGADAQRFPNLIITDKKPRGPKPFTTILISDRAGSEIIRAKPSREKSALSIEMTKVSRSLTVPIQAKNFAYRAFREKYGIPLEVPDDQMIDHLLKQGTWMPQGLPSGLFMTDNAFASEYGNPHLDGEVIIFADQMKTTHFVDILFQTMPQDRVKTIVGKLLAYLATHELGHALGLMHWEEPHNFMKPNSLDFDPMHYRDEHFNRAQGAYLEAVLGR